MTASRVAAVGMILCLAAGVSAETMAQAAAREKKRREEVEKKGSAKVVDDEGLGKYTGGRPLDTGATPPPSSTPGLPWNSDAGTLAKLAGGSAANDPGPSQAGAYKASFQACQVRVQSAQKGVEAAEAHVWFVKQKTNDTVALLVAETGLSGAQKRLQIAKEACDAIVAQARKAGIAEGALY
jgi:hypothetical protein